MPGTFRDGADAFSSGGPYRGFDAADFDAYDPKKWSSNAFTLARRKAKDKLLALARTLREQLGEDLAGLELHASDEAPTVTNGRKVEAQWAFFTRNADARAVIKTLTNTTDLQSAANLFDIGLQSQHACLGLRLDRGGWALTVEIAARAKVDRENAAQKLRQSWARDKLVELCKALPAGSTVGFEPERNDAHALTADQVEAWIAPLMQSESKLVVQHGLSREDPRLSDDSLIASTAAELPRFAHVMRFLSWSRDNEHTQVKEQVKKTNEDRQKAKPAPVVSPGDRVTILSGLFAGRSGYLSEVDAKGRAKVMVGPVSVTVEAKDLKPA